MGINGTGAHEAAAGKPSACQFWQKSGAAKVRPSSSAGRIAVAPAQGYLWAPETLLGKDNFQIQE